MAVSKKDILVIEVRDDAKFQVQFSALDYRNNQFLWQGVTLKESWWVGLTAARDNTLLFHTYVNKGGNPDHKNLIAFDIFRKNIRWEIEEFSFFDWDEIEIWGYRTGEELTQAAIQIESGVVAERKWIATPPMTGADVTRPVRYVEGSPYYETVGKFIRQKTNHQPVKGVEYLEWKEWMMVSVYVEEASSLANYLLVFSLEGEVLLEVKLGEKLTGLGTDTFFMLSGCLFLIKNKTELVAYTFYD
jgi:hypothetical protein